MRLVSVLVSLLRVLLRCRSMLLTFGVIAFAVVLRGGAMRLGCVFVVLRRRIMFVFRHFAPLGLSTPSRATRLQRVTCSPTHRPEYGAAPRRAIAT
jgi:hypothetical protein